jgi:hypothetical protein
MKLSNFSGGLNTRLASHLLTIQEGVEYTNIDDSSGALTPVKSKTASGVLVDEYAHYYVSNPAWVSSSTYRDYVEYHGELYFTEKDSYPKKYSGSVEYRLGIVSPITGIQLTLPSPLSAGVLTGTYQYVYTYYNSNDGTESMPSDLVGEITVVTKRIQLSAIATSNDPQVDSIRLYRIGGTLTDFTLVTTLTSDVTSYIDNISDTAVDGRILESTYNNEGPDKLQYLTEYNGVFFGSVKDKLYYTLKGEFNYWPSTNYLDFEAEITGIGETPSGLVVFTRYKCWLVLETASNIFKATILSGDQGCISHQSIVQFKNTILFVSTDGICGTSGITVDVLTRSHADKLELDVVNAILHDEVYYVQQVDGSTYALTLKLKVRLKKFDLGITRLIRAEDVLYGFVNGELYSLFTNDDYEELTYLSPLLVDSAYTSLKTYKNIYLRYNGNIKIEVYITDTLVKTKEYTGVATADIKVPQLKQNGYSIQFKITGTGTVSELEYKAMDRQNGR